VIVQNEPHPVQGVGQVVHDGVHGDQWRLFQHLHFTGPLVQRCDQFKRVFSKRCCPHTLLLGPVDRSFGERALVGQVGHHAGQLQQRDPQDRDHLGCPKLHSGALHELLPRSVQFTRYAEKLSLDSDRLLLRFNDT
jgi:hypothetical protein